MKTIHIILPTHNRISQLKLFLECLKSQNFHSYHLILCDDGSTDGSAEYVLDQFKTATILQGRGTWWFAGAVHAGYKWIKSNNVEKDEFVLIINDDTQFDKNFLSTGINYLSDRPRTLIQAQTRLQQGGDFVDTGMHVHWKTFMIKMATSESDINCLSTCGLFLRVSDLLEIGGFHPFILPHYWSDYEFTIRAHTKNFTLQTTPQLQLFVNAETTSNISFDNMLFPEFIKKYFSKRNLSNPLYYISLFILAAPMPWKLIHISRAIRTALLTPFRFFIKTYLFHGIKKNRVDYE